MGVALAGELGGGFRFHRSRVEFRRAANGGEDIIALDGLTKYSPYISLEFRFGRRFDAAARIEKRLQMSADMIHIQQRSPNLPRMTGLAYAGPSSWDVRLPDPPENLVQELKVAIEGMAYPFFERFRDMRVARDAIAARDPWCSTGFWAPVFLLDAALEDLDHFRRWSARLAPFDAAQAAEKLARLEASGSDPSHGPG